MALHDFQAAEIVNDTVLDTLFQVIASGSYTPALTAVTTNPTLGTGSAVAGWYVHYASVSSTDQYIKGAFSIKFGTSGAAAGSGAYRVSVPVAASTGSEPVTVGIALLVQASGGLRNLASIDLAGTTIFGLNAHGRFLNVGAADPWAWTNNDLLRGSFFYRA